MLAVIPVRSGELPAGGLETIGEAGGRALLVGERVAEAAESATGHLTECWLAEFGGFAPAAWAEALADPLAAEPKVVLPACPDGRDLAPRLAHRLGRVLLAGATEVADRVRLARRGGLAIEELAGPASFVATLIPGVRGVEPGISSTIDPTWVDMKGGVPAAQDAETVEVLPPDVTTMDLAEAPRIVGGGAGLDGASRFTHPRENKKVKVLVSLSPENFPMGIKHIIASGDMPVVWTNTDYRMIYLNMGHGPHILSDATQNKLIINAFRWVITSDKKGNVLDK